MNQTDFYKITLQFDDNLFNDLVDGVEFENVGKGRIENHLVKISDSKIPIVRTTTKYNIPAHNFSAIHNRIIEAVNSNTSQLPSLNFNNALIEIYESKYSKMKFHSDQCLDLATNSYIGLFSCYENPKDLTEQSLRKLKIKDKTTNEEFEILLTHNSVVLFSTSINSKFYHKIVLEQVPKQKPLEFDNKWLGITFRESKTYIQFNNNTPFFEDGKKLELANEDQKTEYYKLRGEENKSINFNYPLLSYTLSNADLIMPKK